MFLGLRNAGKWHGDEITLESRRIFGCVDWRVAYSYGEDVNKLEDEETGESAPQVRDAI